MTPTTYQLLYLRYLTAQRDYPDLDHRGHGPDAAVLGLTAEDARRQEDEAKREFEREI